ncbi:MAG: hypothetical protein OWS74_02110 [Firmicutes bacterium]|nr:hypothetical protein [Bacillota bacterium]
MKDRVDQKRADYYLYTWQIRELQKISRETQRPTSEVLRSLLSQVLTSSQNGWKTPHVTEL